MHKPSFFQIGSSIQY